jgi:hypothetical protein
MALTGEGPARTIANMRNGRKEKTVEGAKHRLRRVMTNLLLENLLFAPKKFEIGHF